MLPFVPVRGMSNRSGAADRDIAAIVLTRDAISFFAPMKSVIKRDRLSTASLLVWIAASAVLVIRSITTGEPPRWFEILLFGGMLGNAYLTRTMVRAEDSRIEPRVIRILMLVAGVFMLVGQTVNLLAG